MRASGIIIECQSFTGGSRSRKECQLRPRKARRKSRSFYCRNNVWQVFMLTLMIKEANPEGVLSTFVLVVGFQDVPHGGDRFIVTTEERYAKELSRYRQEKL